MSIRLRIATRIVLVLASSTALTVACGDDEGGEEHGASEHGAEEHGHDQPQVCTDISDVCHDLDTGSGMAHDCHETAHAGEAAACEAVHDACISFCTGGTGSESSTSPGESSTAPGESSTAPAESSGSGSSGPVDSSGSESGSESGSGSESSSSSGG